MESLKEPQKTIDIFPLSILSPVLCPPCVLKMTKKTGHQFLKIPLHPATVSQLSVKHSHDHERVGHSMKNVSTHLSAKTKYKSGWRHVHVH